MVLDWLDVNGWEGIERKVVELPYRGDDPIDVYPERYIADVPGFDYMEIAEKDRTEIFSFFDADSSVLLFGSGHSFWANYVQSLPNIASVSVLDYIPEAGIGLNPGIDFYCHNILSHGITGTYDYIFSSHTIEHFTAEQILYSILPACQAYVRKGVVFLVPYQENWSEEPSHKCLFYLGDELFSRARKYKIIRNGLELVLWFEGLAQ